MCVYVYICGGHHDSDRMAVLVMVSKAESILLYFILYMYTCQNKYFLPSFVDIGWLNTQVEAQ